MAEKLTTEGFIEKAKRVHGDRYDYSKSVYGARSAEKLTIICREHGEFKQSANSHLCKHGCPRCQIQKRTLTTKQFIDKAIKIHGNKYDYSKTIHVNYLTKLQIICVKHGPFYQMPFTHLAGHGCPKCCRDNTVINLKHDRKAAGLFIKEANQVHGNKYDYSESNYTTAKTKIAITCRQHGLFHQNTSSHLAGHGCPKCGAEKPLAATQKKSERMRLSFLDKARDIHGETYLYDKTNYVRMDEQIIITCRKHGDFEQYPQNHLRGHGCQACHGGDGVKERYKENKQFFIPRANKMHENKYDYSKVIYKNYNEHITIVCPFHGEFSQTPVSHLKGIGCPLCHDGSISIAEQRIRRFLAANKIEYITEKTFKNLKSQKGAKLRCDFYLPKYDTIIEYDGKQHVKAVPKWGGIEYLKILQMHDKLKDEYAEKNKMRLIRIHHKDEANIESILAYHLLNKQKTNTKDYNRSIWG